MNSAEKIESTTTQTNSQLIFPITKINIIVTAKAFKSLPNEANRPKLKTVLRWGEPAYPAMARLLGKDRQTRDGTPSLFERFQTKLESL